MKIMGFRLKKGTPVLFLLIMFLMLSTILVLYNMDSRIYLNKISRGFLSENSRTFSLFGNNDIREDIRSDIVHCFSGGMEDGTVIIKPGIDYTYDMRGIIYKDGAELPPLISGHFLEKDECMSEDMSAVVGRNLSKDIYDNAGKKYISLSGRVFEVKGIIGGREQGRLDNMVYIPFGTALEISGYETGSYSIDGVEAFIDKSIVNIRGLLSEINIDLAVEGNTDVKNGLPDKIYQIYLGLFVAFILAILSGMGYWLSEQTGRIETERILGAGNIRVGIRLVYSYIRIWLAAFIAGLMASVILYRLGIIYLPNIREYLISALITFLPGFASVFFYIVKSLVLCIRQKRRSILADCLLVAQFALFFWLFGQTGTYYINISTQTWVQNAKLGHKIYTMQGGDGTASSDAASSLESNNMREALNEVQSANGVEYMNLTVGSLSFDMEEKYIKKHFENADVSKYTDAAQVDENMYSEMLEKDGKRCLPLALCQIDYNASRFYISGADGGRVFKKEDFDYTLGDKDIPIMMGHKYKKYFKTGDIIPVKFGISLNAHVIGFLPEHTIYETDLTGNQKALDYYIVMPYFNVKGDITSYEEDVFMLYNYGNAAYGMLVFDENAPDREILDAQKELNEIYKKWNLGTVVTLASPPGIVIFQSETRQSVNLLFSLLLTVAFAGMVALCMSLINKLNFNMKKYAIWILNGCHLSRVVILYISNAFALVGASILAAGWFLRGYIHSNIQFLWLLLAGAAAVMTPCVIILVRRILKIDIETIMRKFD